VAAYQPGAGRRFEAVIEARRKAELEEEFKPLRRGWCVGSAEFRVAMLKYIETQSGQWHYGSELSESGEVKAERRIRETLTTKGITLDQLTAWRKGHPVKVELALRNASRPRSQWNGSPGAFAGEQEAI